MDLHAVLREVVKREEHHLKMERKDVRLIVKYPEQLWVVGDVSILSKVWLLVGCAVLIDAQYAQLAALLACWLHCTVLVHLCECKRQAAVAHITVL